MNPQTTPKHHIGRWILGILAALFAIGLISNANKSSPGTNHQDVSLSGHGASADVAMDRCALDMTLDTPKATLTVTNHSSKTSTYMITVAFNSPTGLQLDTADATAQTVAPGQSASVNAESLKDTYAAFTCQVTQVMRMAS